MILYIPEEDNPDEKKGFKATVVNVMKHNNLFYRISLQFENINEKDQSDIIGYCYLK